MIPPTNNAFAMTRKFAALKFPAVEMIKMSTYAIMVTDTWNCLASLLPYYFTYFEMPIKLCSE